jgi:hypothetical protein
MLKPLYKVNEVDLSSDPVVAVEEAFKIMFRWIYLQIIKRANHQGVK